MKGMPSPMVRAVSVLPFQAMTMVRPSVLTAGRGDLAARLAALLADDDEVEQAAVLTDRGRLAPFDLAPAGARPLACSRSLADRDLVALHERLDVGLGLARLGQPLVAHGGVVDRGERHGVADDHLRAWDDEQHLDVAVEAPRHRHRGGQRAFEAFAGPCGDEHGFHGIAHRVGARATAPRLPLRAAIDGSVSYVGAVPRYRVSGACSWAQKRRAGPEVIPSPPRGIRTRRACGIR
jgi:hypothetical protein